MTHSAFDFRPAAGDVSDAHRMASQPAVGLPSGQVFGEWGSDLNNDGYAVCVPSLAPLSIYMAPIWVRKTRGSMGSEVLFPRGEARNAPPSRRI